MKNMGQLLASKQASKQASRKSALFGGENNRALTHCCMGFYLWGGAVLLS